MEMTSGFPAELLPVIGMTAAETSSRKQLLVVFMYSCMCSIIISCDVNYA